MDPAATLQIVINAHDDGDFDTFREGVEVLQGWLEGGGFGTELHPRCLVPPPPVPTAAWDETSWLKFWVASGCNIAPK